MKRRDTLEVTDRRLVAALQVNPRAGSVEMARALGEHERAVARRLQRLIGARIIHPTAEIDTVRCGLGSVVQVRLEVERGATDQVANVLSRSPAVRRIVSVSGRSDVLWCEVVVGNDGGLHGLMRRGIVPDLPVERFHAATTLRTFTTVARWTIPGLTPTEVKQLRAGTVPLLVSSDACVELTDSDRYVAGELARNSRVTLTELARGLGLSVATASRRVNCLLERGALRLRTEVDPTLVGYPVQAQICLQVRPSGLEGVGAALAELPEVRFCVAVTGTRNMILEVAVEQEADLYRFLGERLGGIAHVSDFTAELITHAYKRGSVVTGDCRSGDAPA